MDTPLAKQKPREIRLATSLLCAYLGLGLVVYAFQFSYLPSQASDGFILFVKGFTLAAVSLLVYFISKGRNWARITLLVWSSLGLILWFPHIAQFFSRETFSRSTLIGLLGVVEVILQVVALFLVFSKPGASWFAQRVSSDAAS